MTVPTAGLKERTSASVPWWLAVVFMIIPMFGLLQLAGASTNECGQATELLPDRLTGELRNCDGSEFEGRGPAGGGTDFIALGEGVYLGSAGCSGCHGVQGGGGVGPALNTVMAVFSSCLDHVDWVAKGTQGYQAEGRTGYGDLNKAFGSVQMPGFANTLSAEQLAAVSAFERVRFGGEPREGALVDCGLAEAEGAGEEGEGEGQSEGEGEGEGQSEDAPPAPGEVPADGTTDLTTP
ncbi:MAG TPA: c-type cytochrome [Acidimicrobiia bacterium]|nr:c-type cytochrome [Acidimicrobiia bacterium]